MKIPFLFLFTAICVVSVYSLEIQFEFDPNDEDALPSAISKAVHEAYELNKSGLEALGRKEYDAALAYFDEALVKFPEYSDAFNNRGVVYYRRGIVSEAQKIWENLAARDPGYAIASYNLGLVYLHERQLEASGRLFERAIKADGKFVEAYVRLGMVNLESGRKEKALEYLKKAYKTNSEHQDSWSFYAHALIVTGDTAGAVSVLRRKDSHPEALSMLGRIEGSRKNYVKAAEYLSNAVSKGAPPSLLVELASAQVENNRCKDALTTLKKYFAQPQQQEADAWLLAGIASKECGDLSGAQKYFEEGAKKFPQDPIIKYNLGKVYFRQKSFDKAEETWGGLADTIQDPSLLYIRALNARRRNDLDGAEKMIRRAIDMDARSEYHDFLGVIYHLKKDEKKAEEQFRKALKIEPDNRSAQMNLALSARKGEDLDALASKLQKQIASCCGDSCADLSFQLSIVFYHQKALGKAAQALAAIKEEDKDERIYRHLAIYYRENHEWDKSIAALEAAAKRLVLEPQTEYELAETYLLAGYYRKAAERFFALLPKWKQNPWRLYYQLGYAYLEQNELDKAQENFEKSLKSKPDNVASRGLLAFVHNRKGNVGEARKLWERNIKDDPSNPSLWINMGLSLENDGRYEEALEHYKKAAMLKGNDKELQINIGNAYAGMEKHTDAMNAYNQALSSGKRDLAAYNIFLVARKKKDREKAESMSRLLKQEFATSLYTKRVQAEMALWNGDTTKAVQILEGLPEKDAADWLSLGGIYAARGNSEKTKTCLDKLPDEAYWKKAAHSVRAQLAFQKGDYDQALRMLKESGDTSFAAKYNIALAAYNAGQHQEALRIVERISAHTHGNDRADCSRLAGNAAFALKQWDKARQWYMQLSNVEAQSPVVQYNLAVAFYNLNKVEDAWKHYDRAKKLDKSIFNKDIEAKYRHLRGGDKTDSVAVLDSADIWYNQAVQMQSEGKDTAAEQLYQKVIKKDPMHSLSWNNLGAIYGARGDIDNAEKAYWKAIEKRYDIPETYANLVNLYIELEEFTKARQWIIKGIGHNPESELLEGFRERIVEAEKAAKERKQE